MKRTSYWIIGGVVIVVLLAGGVFMVMRLLNAHAQNSAGGEGRGQFIWATELPQQSADLVGMVTSVQNNSIYVVPGQQFLPSKALGRVPTPSGPPTEVVVTQNTKIWRDVTAEKYTPEPNAPRNVYHQQVESADISAIAAGNGTEVQVWGQLRGDRLTAEVIVVVTPIVFGQ